MNKQIITIFSLIFLIGFASAFSGSGLGTTSSPFQITNCDELNQTRDNLTASYILMNDINFSECDVSYTTGKGWKPIGYLYEEGSFSGNFNGNGYVVYDMFINRTTINDFGGFFGSIQFAKIENLGIKNFNIYGKNDIGGLAGWNGLSSINNTYTSGNITGEAWVGGLVGDNKGNISNSYSDVNIYRTSGIPITYFGGLIGKIDTGTFAKNITIKNTYSKSRISYIDATDPTDKGFVDSDDMYNRTTYLNDFWDINVSKQLTSGGDAIGKTTTQMQNISTFSTWDIINISQKADGYVDKTYIWNIVDNESYPFLSWEYSSFPDGNGSSTDPYQIETWAQLNEVSNYLSSDFILMNDLNSSSTGYDTYASSSANSGAGWTPIGISSPYFTGTFEGQNNTISDLYINRSSGRAGLFALANGAIIKNIGLININITGYSQVGGIVGFLDDGTISNSYSTGNINATTLIGGLIGYQDGSASIINSYSNVDVYGTTSGGLVGQQVSGYINNSYSIGYISGNNFAGGLIGSVISGTTSNSFWDINTSNQTSSAGGIGKTTTQMQNISTFSTWDIINITADENSYPYLSWEVSRSDYVWLINQTVSEETTPPTINWVESISAVTLNGGTTKTINILFNASDVSGLNTSTVNLSIYKVGETTRYASTCNNNTYSNQFNCTITMQFYDGDGVWNINASISDDLGNLGTNTSQTFTVNTLDYITQDVVATSWAGVIYPNSNDNEADTTIVLTNGGNQDYGTIEVKGYNATGTSYAKTITAESFSIDDLTGQTTGQVYMVDSTYETVSQLNGLNSHGASITEEVFFYVDLLTDLSADTYTSDSSWSIKCST